MSLKNKLLQEPIDRTSLAIRMLVGGGIALFLVILFLVGAGEPDPNWPRFWMLKPLVIVPLAGAMGGFCSYVLDRMLPGKKIIAVILGLVVYIIGFYMGFVLGMDGTYWN
jgi:hypothetical protein